MTTPRPVPDAALHRLRRNYALLMLLLALPVLGAIAYVLVLQFRIVWIGTERQIAMSTDRRMTRLDGALAPMRDNLLRLRNAARDAGLPPVVVADREALRPVGADGHALDALPSVLQDRSPQVLLAGPDWRDVAERHAAVDRAAQFAEQARLAMSQGARFRRVMFVDADGGEAWIYPWVRSDELLAELKVGSLAEAQRALAACAVPGPAAAQSIFNDDVGWRFGPDAEGAPSLSLSTQMVALAGSAQQRTQLVCAELPSSALEAARVEAGIGRFWLVDAQSQPLWSYVASDDPGGAVAVSPPPFVERSRIAAALAAPLAISTDGVLMSARASSVAPWTGVYASDGAYIRGLVLRDLGPYAAGGAALMLLFALVSTALWRRFGQPSLRLVDYLHRKAIDTGAPEPSLPGAWSPWMRLIRDTFAASREAQAREAQAQALKSAIVDHALAAIVSTDAEGRIVEFNPAAETMFGCRREKALGRAVAEIVVPPRLRSAGDGLASLTAGAAAGPAGGGEPVLNRRLEVTAQRCDGTEFTVEMVMWRIELDGVVRYTASMVDQTERQQARGEIERQRERLRQSEKLSAMGSLLAGVAHELNNPLAIVMGRAGLLEEKVRDESIRADAQRIREAAERCGRIVRTFLNMARSRPARRDSVALNDLVCAAADMLGYTFRSHGITLELALEEGLPSVLADADQVGQIVLNLLVNAQQALSTVDGPRRVRVTSGIEPRRDHRAQRVWLRVVDNGTGVPRDLRERIFEPFFTTKPEGIGTGQGLAVSRSLAREHGGDLQLEVSEAGQGASFRLSLPMSGEAEAPVSAPAPMPVDAAARARVLVADDEPEIAELMREMLEGEGYEVATAESGAVALELLQEARFDLIVSDLRMPEMDGAAFWSAVRERHPSLARRMIFVTGDTLSPGARQFLSDTRCESLDKPFSKTDLLDKVAAALA